MIETSEGFAQTAAAFMPKSNAMSNRCEFAAFESQACSLALRGDADRVGSGPVDRSRDDRVGEQPGGAQEDLAGANRSSARPVGVLGPGVADGRHPPRTKKFYLEPTLVSIQVRRTTRRETRQTPIAPGNETLRENFSACRALAFEAGGNFPIEFRPGRDVCLGGGRRPRPLLRARFSGSQKKQRGGILKIRSGAKRTCEPWHAGGDFFTG